MQVIARFFVKKQKKPFLRGRWMESTRKMKMSLCRYDVLRL